MPCAIRSIGFMSCGDLAEIAFGDADDRRAAALQTAHQPLLHRREHRIGRLVARRPVHAEADPHADPAPPRVDVLDPAHQPEALVAIDQGDVVGLALAGWVTVVA